MGFMGLMGGMGNVGHAAALGKFLSGAMQ